MVEGDTPMRSAGSARVSRRRWQARAILTQTGVHFRPLGAITGITGLKCTQRHSAGRYRSGTEGISSHHRGRRLNDSRVVTVIRASALDSILRLK